LKAHARGHVVRAWVRLQFHQLHLRLGVLPRLLHVGLKPRVQLLLRDARAHGIPSAFLWQQKVADACRGLAKRVTVHTVSKPFSRLDQFQSRVRDRVGGNKGRGSIGRRCCRVCIPGQDGGDGPLGNNNTKPIENQRGQPISGNVQDGTTNNFIPTDKEIDLNRSVYGAIAKAPGIMDDVKRMADALESVRDMLLIALVLCFFLLVMMCVWGCYCRRSYYGYRGGNNEDDKTATTMGGGWVPFGVDDSAAARMNYTTLNKAHGDGGVKDGNAP